MSSYSPISYAYYNNHYTTFVQPYRNNARYHTPMPKKEHRAPTEKEPQEVNKSGPYYAIKQQTPYPHKPLYDFGPGRTYTAIKPLENAGACGTVEKAKDARGKLVVVKLTKTFIAMRHREKRATPLEYEVYEALGDHPDILSLLNFSWEYGGADNPRNLTSVYPYCDKGDLHDMIKEFDHLDKNPPENMVLE